MFLLVLPFIRKYCRQINILGNILEYSKKYVLTVLSGRFEMIEDPARCFHHFSHLLAQGPQGDGTEILSFAESSTVEK